MAHLHGGDGVHAGGSGSGGGCGAGEAAGVLVEAVHQIRRLVQHEVVLLHERVAHLRSHRGDTSRSASGTRREPRGNLARPESGDAAYHLRRRRRVGGGGGRLRRGHGGAGSGERGDLGFLGRRGGWYGARLPCACGGVWGQRSGCLVAKEMEAEGGRVYEAEAGLCVRRIWSRDLILMVCRVKRAVKCEIVNNTLMPTVILIHR